jgi:predicted alpha/beta superfamily hydrolase
MLPRILCALALVFPLGAAAADAPPPVVLPRTETRFLTAPENGVAYRLLVALPPGYADTDRTYPLVLLLDADYSFAIARNIVEHQADRDRIDPCVLVGVAYEGPVTMQSYRRNRSRDYTPVPSDASPYDPAFVPLQGGGAKFADFIEKTLLPRLAADYRIGATRVLVGHSFGGLFAAHTLVTRPALFTGYIVVSPSLWYEKRFIFDEEARRARGREAIAARVYLAVGDREHSEHGDMRADLERFETQLAAHGYPALKLRRDVLDDETHDSVWPRAFSNGIRWVLGDR